MDPIQLECFNAMKNGKNVFITGGGGVGKSYLIRIFRNWFFNKKYLGITSTTGISALEIGGTTIHSYLGLGLGKDNSENLYNKIRRNKFIFNKWRIIKTLIIDEVSMLQPKLLEVIEEVARMIRCNDKPFGGIQLIFCGDFCQLPCINSNSFCFETEVWKTLNFTIFYLKKSYRQDDIELFELLNECRLGNLSEKSIKILSSRNIDIGDKKDISPVKPTKLFAINKSVDELNINEISLLLKNTKEYYQYQIEVINQKVSDDYIIKYIQNMNIYESTVCIGTQVMITANIDIEGGIVNGSRGVITGFEWNDKQDSKIPLIKIKNGKTIKLDYYSQEIKDDNDKTIFIIKYIPLRLAYAISIHKSQGLTLDCVQIDFLNIFEYGQAYVALSRIKNLDSLYLMNFDSRKIKCHPKAKEFYEKI